MAKSIGVHDVGGLDVEDVLDIEDKNYAFWEREVHALLVFLVKNKKLSVDELRRAVESLEPEMYNTLSYYERWTAAIVTLLIERGIISRADIEASHGPPIESNEVMYKVGDFVRVKPEGATRRWRKPHLRIPGYIHGAAGVVEAVRGIFEDPAYVAFRDPSPPQPLYTVRFIAREVWGAALPANVVEPPSTDTLGVDVFQPWLEMAARPPESANTNPDHSLPNVVVHAQTGSSCGKEHHDENTHAGGGHSHAGHSHQHGEDGEEHTHLPRAEVEQRAVEIEGEERPLQPLASALLAALETRGVVTRAALRAAVDTLDTARERGYGVTLVVRAWTDLAFKARLLADPAAAAAELGIQTSNYAAAAAAGDVSFHPGAVRRHAPGETVLRVVENTDEEHHLVVCTLCSCYPIAVLGMSPPWYKSRAYRARAVREPRSLLRDFGLELPAGVVLHVHDSTAEVRYLVLPARPSGTEGWDEERLRGLVTRDCMIGVAVPRPLAAA